MTAPEWGAVFQVTTPVVEILARGTVVFLAIYAMLRVAGKREAGAHSLTDLLVVVLVAEAAAHGMAGEARGVGDSVLLIVDGAINRRALRREFMQPEELMAELRLHGVTDVREVARVYLEANGMISVIRAGPSDGEERPKPPLTA